MNARRIHITLKNFVPGTLHHANRVNVTLLHYSVTAMERGYLSGSAWHVTRPKRNSCPICGTSQSYGVLHIWLVAPVQLTLQMLNALQSTIVQRISSVTWFTAGVYCKISDDCVDCEANFYSREQVGYCCNKQRSIL